MRVRVSPSLAAALLVGAALAGCLGEADTGDPAAKPAVAGDPGAPSPGNVTSNVTVDDGTAPMDPDLGHRPHIHDYWHGKERVTLLDIDVEPDPGDALRTTVVSAFFRHEPALGGTEVELPDGATVFEGTGLIEVTATWSDPTITSLSLRYVSAASSDWSEPQPLATASAFPIEVTPEMTDMPHMSTSRWGFLFVPGGTGQSAYGKFHVKVDIVKMRDIGLFPGHPELFGGKHEKVLLDADGKSESTNWAMRIAGAVTGTSDDRSLAPQEIVPMETLGMIAQLKITDAKASVGQVGEIHLLYQSADTNRWRGADLAKADEGDGTLIFVIPVDMKMVDSPYAAQSQWRFTVWANSDPTGQGLAECPGCTDVELTYHLTVTAYDHEVSAANFTSAEGGAAVATPEGVESLPAPLLARNRR